MDLHDSTSILDEFEVLGPGEVPVQALVAAAGLRPPQTRAPRSVFELCASRLPARRLTAGLKAPAVAAEAPASIKRVELDADRVRVVHVPVQQTAAWQEKEQRRRAKQRPPKPTARYKRKGKGKKLLSLIGDDNWDA